VGTTSSSVGDEVPMRPEHVDQVQGGRNASGTGIWRQAYRRQGTKGACYRQQATPYQERDGTYKRPLACVNESYGMEPLAVPAKVVPAETNYQLLSQPIPMDSINASGIPCAAWYSASIESPIATGHPPRHSNVVLLPDVDRSGCSL
jgi:hypothetical protein